MQTIFLVRHGETQWNVEGRMQGQVQHIKLNEEGIRQSKLIAKRLEKEKLDLIYSSPMERALQTAEIIAEPHGLSIVTHAGLAERAHGAVDGMTLDELRKKYPEVADVYEKTRELPDIEGAETLAQAEERVFSAFNEIAGNNPGKNIVIVSHGGACKRIIHRLTGKDTDSFKQHNCCLNIIKHDGKKYNVEKIDDTAHLEMELD